MSHGTAPHRHDGFVDRLAIGLSGLCLIHCAATGLALALAASIGGVLLDPLIHEIGLALAMLMGAFAFSQGWRCHGRISPLLLGVIGLCVMALALALGHGDPAELPLTMAGVSAVAIGHQINRRSMRLR